MSALPALIEKLSALQGPSREVDAEIVVALGLADTCPFWLHRFYRSTPMRLTSSVDDAIALTERVLPGYRRMIAHNWAFIQGTDPASRKFVTELHPIEIDGEYYNADDTFDTRAFGPTEPIALVLATLRALAPNKEN